MALHSLLSKKRDSILKRWFHLILETYPADGLRFFKREKDRFINPVGYAISKEIEAMYDGLLSEENLDKLLPSLENIIKIRSVQDFSPSQAIAFIFLMKRAIREELESEIRGSLAFEELLHFETKIDRLILLAFDTYMRCREKIYEIRVKEMKAEREYAISLLRKGNLEE